MSEFGTEDLSIDESGVQDEPDAEPRRTESDDTGQRVLLSGICIALGLFHLVPEYAPGVYDTLLGTFGQVWIFTVRPFADVGIWLELWDQSVQVPFMYAYAIGFVGQGVVAYTRRSSTILRDVFFFFGGNVVVYWTLIFLWDEWGTFGQFLTADVLYTGLYLGVLGLFVLWSDAVTPSGG
jgi:hypothetical protein